MQTQAKLDAMNKELLKSIPGFVPAEDEGDDEETVQLMEEETKLKAELSQLKSDAAGAERAQEAENDELQGLKKRHRAGGMMSRGGARTCAQT